MPVTLAATWNPRGETLRFRRLYPTLSRLYNKIIVVMPPNTHVGMVLSFRVYDKISIVVADNWPAGRFIALKEAAAVNTNAIHYADLDRLVRWAETRPEELTTIVAAVDRSECLVIGRSQAAYATHPRALVETEEMSNRMFSHILGMPLDLSAGSKGFRRDVAQFIVKHGNPGNALGTDSEWVVLAKRGGYKIEQQRVHGLDWENADRYSNTAADADQQRAAAAEYDANPKNWKHRVAVANEIIDVGIQALTRKLD